MLAYRRCCLLFSTFWFLFLLNTYTMYREICVPVSESTLGFQHHNIIVSREVYEFVFGSCRSLLRLNVRDYVTIAA